MWRKLRIRPRRSRNRQTFPWTICRSVCRSVCLSSALCKNGGSDIWHRRSDRSRDEAGGGVCRSVHGKGYFWGRISGVPLSKGAYRAYVCYSAETRPSSQITLGRLVVVAYIGLHQLFLIFAAALWRQKPQNHLTSRSVTVFCSSTSSVSRCTSSIWMVCVTSWGGPPAGTTAVGCWAVGLAADFTVNVHSDTAWPAAFLAMQRNRPCYANTALCN